MKPPPKVWRRGRGRGPALAPAPRPQAAPSPARRPAAPPLLQPPAASFPWRTSGAGVWGSGGVAADRGLPLLRAAGVVASVAGPWSPAAAELRRRRKRTAGSCWALLDRSRFRIALRRRPGTVPTQGCFKLLTPQALSHQ